MIYVSRVRKLAKIVEQEIDDSTDPAPTGSSPNLQYCLILFQQRKKLISRKKFTLKEARKILAIATAEGEKQYLNIKSPKGHNGAAYSQMLVLRSEGLKLLTPSGYFNALCDSISNISSVITWLIALAALVVSIIAINHSS